MASLACRPTVLAKALVVDPVAVGAMREEAAGHALVLGPEAPHARVFGVQEVDGRHDPVDRDAQSNHSLGKPRWDLAWISQLGGFGEEPIPDREGLGQQRGVKPEDLKTTCVSGRARADLPVGRGHHVDLAGGFSAGGRSRP